MGKNFEDECPQGELYKRLHDYTATDVYPFHMPGHKRQLRPFAELYGIDITEIDGFDNLHHAEGILREAQRRAAELYHAQETYYLVNGSTCGILAAVSAAVRRGGKLLMARNCHKAAYHALLLNSLEAAYLYPPVDMARGMYGSLSPQAVRQALAAHPDVQAVLLTSPTYDGVVSDVRAIAEAVHEAGAVLIVDEAHGAHFGMHPCFPEHSLACGADLVINSLHKTLPSLTQTALLHVQGPHVDRERLRRYLGIYQSSSPSYVFMANMDACVKLLQERGAVLFGQFAERLARLREALAQMKVLHLVDGQEKELECFAYDRSKVVISTERSPVDGAELCGILRERYHLEMEMEALHYVTAITTIADTPDGLNRLQEALLEIDAQLAAGYAGAGGLDRAEPSMEAVNWKELCGGEVVLRISEAEDVQTETVPLSESGGRVSAEFAYLYPPGIPLVVPGERISKDLPKRLEEYQSRGLRLQGLADYEARTIRVAASCFCEEEAEGRSGTQGMCEAAGAAQGRM